MNIGEKFGDYIVEQTSRLMMFITILKIESVIEKKIRTITEKRNEKGSD